MNLKFTRRDATAAVALLSHTPQQHGSLSAMGEDTSTTELVRRANIMRRLIKTRAMMHETRNKVAELQNAIERFKERKAKMSNG